MRFICDQLKPLQNPRSTELKISKFLETQMTNEGVKSIVKQATFKNPRAKYDMVTYTLGRTE